jgi:rhodanese-related sulfurtransferase
MQQINFSELQQLQQTQNILLIDVREKNEHDAFNIGGSLIPLGDIITNANAIPKDIPVVLYCRKGIRSQIAIQRLEDKFGFTNLINLRGGIGDGDKEK